MMPVLEQSQQVQPDPRAGQTVAMIEYLRGIMCAVPSRVERFHAIFLDDRQTYLADAAMGLGGSATLSLRMRDLFSKALSIGASGLIIAHNHPSGDCRPSLRDIDATKKLKDIAIALDIELLDHLIITQSAAYSMRAGGRL